MTSEPEADDRAWSLETLGRVAEGVVHDFNNVLAAISGLAELMLQPSPTAGVPSPGSAADAGGNRDNRDREFAHLILQAALSGQGLVKELKTFSGKGRHVKEILDLHEVLGQGLAVARGALGGRIAIASDFAPGPVRIHGCRGLLQNALLNLLLNARDAMPRGGRIIVRTALLSAAEGLGRESVEITVRDTGMGMRPEVLKRIFERRYTTKGPKGSGLGLANVMRTVKQHQGAISVDSEPGAGTEFRILLPRSG